MSEQNLILVKAGAIKIQISTLHFNLNLKPREISMFRGAIIALTSREKQLFHNHLDKSGYRYAYPLIQYKLINKRAAIVALGEGIKEVNTFPFHQASSIKIGTKTYSLELESQTIQYQTLEFGTSLFTYHITNWIGLNQENYIRYMNLTNILERVVLLENIMVGHILAFASGIGVHLTEPVKLEILEITNTRLINYKNTKHLAFELKFNINLSLPPFIGLGKGTSIGNGIVVSIN